MADKPLANGIFLQMDHISFDKIYFKIINIIEPVIGRISTCYMHDFTSKQQNVPLLNLVSSLPSTPIKRLPSLEAPCTQLLQWHMYQLYGTYPTTTPVCTPLCQCCSVLLLVVLCWLLLLPIRSIGCLPSVKQSKRSTPRASGLYRWEHSNSTLPKFQLTTKLICMSSPK